jgi:hypothetical protein
MDEKLNTVNKNREALLQYSKQVSLELNRGKR